MKQQIAELKQQIDDDPLNRRVAELERVISEMLASMRR